MTLSYGERRREFLKEFLDKFLDEFIRKKRSGEGKHITMSVRDFALDLPRKWKLTEADVDDIFENLNRSGMVTNLEDGMKGGSEKFLFFALYNRFPDIPAEKMTDYFELLSASDFSANSLAHVHGLNDFCRSLNDIGKLKKRGDIKYSNDEIMDALKSVDNNLFRFSYSMVGSVENFKSGAVMKIGDNELPEETLKSCLSFIMTDKSKIFHCSDAVADLLMLTDNEIGKRNLPFSSVFVDVNFKHKRHVYFGMLLTSIEREGDLLVFSKKTGDDVAGFHVLAMGYDVKDNSIVYNFTAVTDDGLYKPSRNDHYGKFLAEFACNFLDFLHDPNVHYVKASESSGHSHKFLRARYERLKIDLDKTYFIKIEDPLRRYIDQCAHMRTMKGYSHRFWVRGHWRTYRSERYGERVGTRQWIKPFIKGKGMLIEKRYDIEKREDDSNGSGS